MKKLLPIIALALMPVGAMAQVSPETYRIANPSQAQGINTTSQSITEGILSQVVRVTCSANCWININVSGQSIPATTITGTYLPANVPQTFIVSKGSKIAVIGATAGGTLYVQELTK